MENQSKMTLFLIRIKLPLVKRNGKSDFYLPFLFRTEESCEKFMKTAEARILLTNVLRTECNWLGKILSKFYLLLRWKIITWEINTRQFSAPIGNMDKENYLLEQVKASVKYTLGAVIQIRS